MPNQNRLLLFKANEDYLNKIEKYSDKYTVELLTLNSVNSDYGASFYGEDLIFASARDTDVLTKKNHSWNNENFTDLFCG